MKVLVTGGSGMVGKTLQKIHPNWIYLSRKDGDLRDFIQCREIFEEHRPNAIVHLAAHVGGLYMNLKNNKQMFMDNMKIQLNVIQCCEMYDIKHGVFCLSTCVFPDKTEYPLYESMLHNGPPHDSNYGYAYAKRMLEVMCRDKYSCIIPVNIYGPYDNFNLDNGHVIPALIHRAYLAKKYKEIFKIKGSGQAMRQFIHAGDVAKYISRLLWKSPQTIILAPDEEQSIKNIVNIIAKKFELKFIQYDSRFSDGQLRKTSANDKIKKLFPDIILENFETGLNHTIDWFVDNYPNVRI